MGDRISRLLTSIQLPLEIEISTLVSKMRSRPFSPNPPRADLVNVLVMAVLEQKIHISKIVKMGECANGVSHQDRNKRDLLS